MATFTDTGNNTWNLRVDTFVLIQFENETNVSLLSAGQSRDTLRAVFSKLGSIVRLAFLACQEQVIAKGLTYREFCSLIDANNLDKVGFAVMVALKEYFPKADAVAEGNQDTVPLESMSKQR